MVRALAGFNQPHIRVCRTSQSVVSFARCPFNDFHKLFKRRFALLVHDRAPFLLMQDFAPQARVGLLDVTAGRMIIYSFHASAHLVNSPEVINALIGTGRLTICTPTNVGSPWEARSTFLAIEPEKLASSGGLQGV